MARARTILSDRVRLAHHVIGCSSVFLSGAAASRGEASDIRDGTTVLLRRCQELLLQQHSFD